MKKLIIVLLTWLITMPSFAKEKLEVVIPYGAGGPIDIYTRRLVNHINTNSSLLDLDIVNKSGGNGVVGISYFDNKNKAILMMTGTGIVEGQKLYSNKDFLNKVTPVFVMAEESYFFYTSLPITNLKELLEIAKTKGLIIGHGAPGGGSYDIFFDLCNRLKVIENCNFVPYRSSSFAIPDLLGSRINIYTSTYNETLVLNTKINVIAATGSKRFSLLPNVPTIMENNIPYEYKSWIGLFSAGLSASENNHLKQLINTYMTPEEYKRNGYEKLEDNPSDLLKNEIEKRK